MALLGLLAVAVMVFAYVLTSRLNAASRFVGIDREHNARVLSQAKQALVGWMANNAAEVDNNPGRLPCPEAVNAIGTDSEGIAAPLVTPSTPNCATVGRLPWRTLGLDKLVDANAEPLWYVVSPGWALQNSSTLLTINSDSRGSMVIDGQAAPNDVVAMIIAPGPAMNVQAAAGCTARSQARAAAAPAMNALDYVECFNAATPAFSTTGPATSFNDQVVRVTVGDLIPELEAAIAERMQREIAPALRSMYTSSLYSGIPASSPLYPYAAPFTNPGTSTYQPPSCPPTCPPAVYQGLLPVNQASSMVVYASTPGSVVETLGYGSIDSQSCWWESVNNVRVCEGLYKEDEDEPWRPIQLQLTARFDNVAMGLRAIDTTRFQFYAKDNSGSPPWSPVTASHAATMHSDGSVTLRVSATMPNINDEGWDTRAEFRIRLERAVIGDHAVVSSGDSTLGWFVRNEWHRTTYYATVRRNTAVSLSTLGCIDSSDTNEGCLRFNNSSTRNIRALLVLAGRSLNNPAGRPNATLSDYVEYQNGDLGVQYDQRPVRMSKVSVPTLNAPWNDRVILVDWNSGLLVPDQATVALTSSSPLPPRLTTLP